MNISKTWSIGALIVGSFIALAIFGAIASLTSRLMFGQKGELALLPAVEINAKLRRARSISYLAFSLWMVASIICLLVLEPLEKVAWPIGGAAAVLMAVIYGLLDPRGKGED